MRSFPGAACAPVVALATRSPRWPPLAFADDDRDDLRDKQQQVEHQINQVHDDLDEASRAVARSTRRLEQATARLGDARERLQRVRADLQDARAERLRLARALVRAEARFDRVSAELSAARADVAEGRALLRSTVLGMETQGNPDLAVMDAVTSSGSIEELLVAQTAGTMILGREDQALAAFETAEAALEEWKDEVRDARDEVAEQKEAAAQNLLAIRGLFTDARDTRAEVARWVDRSRSARHAAVKARKHDRAALERLKDREARIKREILRLAQQAAQQDNAPTYTGSTDGLLQMPGQRSGDLAVRLADAPDLRLLGPARRHRLRRRAAARRCGRGSPAPSSTSTTTRSTATVSTSPSARSTAPT